MAGICLRQMISASVMPSARVPSMRIALVMFTVAIPGIGLRYSSTWPAGAGSSAFASA